MNWSRFFELLNRFNAIGIALFLILVPLMFGIMAWRDYASIRDWDMPSGDKRYGYSGLQNEPDYEGEEIVLRDGLIIKYQIEGEPDSELEVSGENISLTNMKTRQSRIVLPSGSEQIVLRWEVVGKDGEGSAEPSVYMVLAGTPEDYEDGLLDLILGEFDNLEQKTIAERIRFVDAPRMIDDTTLSVIVWTQPDAARFWIVDTSTFRIVTDRPVQVPPPREEEL